MPRCDAGLQSLKLPPQYVLTLSAISRLQNWDGVRLVEKWWRYYAYQDSGFSTQLRQYMTRCDQGHCTKSNGKSFLLGKYHGTLACRTWHIFVNHCWPLALAILSSKVFLISMWPNAGEVFARAMSLTLWRECGTCCICSQIDTQWVHVKAFCCSTLEQSWPNRWMAVCVHCSLGPPYWGLAMRTPGDKTEQCAHLSKSPSCCDQ